MAQPTPPPPSSRAPNLSAPNSNVPNASTNGLPFVPRREFIRDQRVVSSFSLLALSGPNLVRLYSFPLPVISALRRLFDHQNLTVRVREHSSKNFFEFSLNGRPWASPKTIESEKLIVGIMSSVLQCGYSFLSTVEYGREPDDRLAIAFSKRVAMNVLSSSGQSANGSAVTLLQPVRTPFAISFVSPSVLHVIGPPLHSTPAILQAVRGSWPRGVVSEKKLGDAIYQFKLKGYKFFQQDTFAADSLQQILTVLTTLDTHAFMLMTSLTLTKRSRKHDLWIFTGPPEDVPVMDSPYPSPIRSSLELQDSSPYAAQASNEKLAPVVSPHRVGSTTPSTSSPLKPSSPTMYKAQGQLLRKPSPKIQLPRAYLAEADSATSSPVDSKQHPFSSSMGSVDMTGIGSGRGGAAGERLSRSPDIFYVAAGAQRNVHGYRNDHTPWRPTSPPVPPAEVLFPMFTRQDAKGHAPPQSPAARDMVSPMPHSRGPSTGNSSPTIRISTSSPPLLVSGETLRKVHSPLPKLTIGNDYFSIHHHDTDVQDGMTQGGEGPPSRPAAPDTPRTPTPPLLTPGVFRDSAFSSTTGQSYEIPITWAGGESELGRGMLAGIKEEDEASRQNNLQSSQERLGESSQTPRQDRMPAEPLPRSAWAPTPNERKSHDVATMLSPTIQELSNQEQDGHGHFIGKVANRHSRGDSAREASRSSERRAYDRGRAKDPSGSSLPPSDKTARSRFRTPTPGELNRVRSPTRRDTDTSGWVIVNVDDSKGKGRKTQSVSPGPTHRVKSPNQNPSLSAPPSHRPVQHMRSSSDSRLPRLPQSNQREPAVAKGSMAPAAKAIVLIDAMDANKQGSALKRLFRRSKDKGQSAQSTQAPDKSVDASRYGPRNEGEVMQNDRDEKKSRERWKFQRSARASMSC
ncbi:uncharacterized protein LAESUDRAFT_725634 [Laetiporus sulphureus 93-53]|uniref:Uncharacterized protein n=1 Tax=Laetiporus sulphureus 93-53 TaxID=1314785 RepID=A0A165EEJ1_9APHY|nr:uncharacterized protein LAESUDRAFT_725634 [Laetiporus sulphureus 93-53]KZT06883.1 hypothetical protein LAESUDRAFT_725634 [Laetiporus sulphureus 93-53]